MLYWYFSYLFYNTILLLVKNWVWICWSDNIWPGLEQGLDMMVGLRLAGTRTVARYVGWFTSGRDSNRVWICWSEYVRPGLELGLDMLVGLHLAGTRTGSG